MHNGTINSQIHLQCFSYYSHKLGKISALLQWENRIVFKISVCHLKPALRERLLMNESVEVRALGGHLQQKIGSIAQIMPLRLR